MLYSLKSGILGEQINSQAKEPMSVSPLTWSQGTYIATVQEYLNKLLELDICKECHMPILSKRKCPESSV